MDHRGAQGRQPEIEPLAAAQARRLLNEAATMRNGARWVIALLGLGLRQGEALGLQWCQRRPNSDPLLLGGFEGGFAWSSQHLDCQFGRFAVKTCAGVRHPKMRLGRLLRSSSTRRRSSGMKSDRSSPFVKYWRMSPFMFSLVPRSQGRPG
jgi:hypothetical protein